MRAPASHELLALQEALVGRYSVQREVGRGGMGIVYLAHDVSLDRSVALKLLPPELAAQAPLRERFLREARTAARLSHPNIVPIHAVEAIGDFVFYVMAYVEGETLKERVRARGPLPPAEAARVLREVAWALAYAHAHGVVHRDVKADNVLLEAESGRAMVMDFGIAQVREGEGLTAAGEVLGTAEFMSPEQAGGEEVDARSDVYSMGILGHYVLTGTLPFQGSTVAATLAQHLTRPAPPLARVAPHVPEGLARAVDRCLEKDREKRFADGEKLAEELSRALEERRTVPVPVRSFIEQSQERFKGLWGWLFFALYFVAFGVVTLAMVKEPIPALVVFAFAMAIAGAPLGLLARMTRALQRAGYDRGDLVRALDAQIQARVEEQSFELGAKKTWIDRLGPVMVFGGLAATVLGTAGAVLLDVSGMSDIVGKVLGILTVTGFVSSLTGLPLAVMRMGRGRKIPGQRWLRFWKGRPGRWLFEFSGVRLDVESAAPGYRPTEVLIGTAVDRLFGGLSKTMQRELADLPDVLERLEADAQGMRGHVEALDKLLAQVDEAPERVGAEERVRLREDLERARAEARARMGEAMVALETIRLGLLRLHAGEGSVERLTEALGSAHEVSEQIERLIAGNREVADLLGSTS